MDVIFYNTKEYSTYLESILHPYLSKLAVSIEFFDIEQKEEVDTILQAHGEDIHILFYQIKEYVVKQTQGRTNRNTCHIYAVAICEDYEQGMQALRNGSDYALLLPLQMEKVKRCALFLANHIENAFS